MQYRYAPLALVLVPGLSFAQVTYDVTDATAAIDGGGNTIAVIGLAALVIVVGLKMWKRFRGAA
jgi:hypothetical protein